MKPALHTQPIANEAEIEVRARHHQLASTAGPEVSAEMIAAGERELLYAIGGSEVTVNHDPDELALAVYRAMERARGQPSAGKVRRPRWSGR